MKSVADRGKMYGLSLNFSKVERISVNCEYSFLDPEGIVIKSKSHLKYLGAQIATDGTIDSELGQKLNTAARDFKKLQQVWSHSSLSCQFKMHVYIACIIQKLLYGLESAWINSAGKRAVKMISSSCDVLSFDRSSMIRVPLVDFPEVSFV